MKAARELARGEQLRVEGLISENDLDTLRANAGVTDAARRTAEFNRSFAVITSPRDGSVLRRLAEEREVVQQGQTVLVVGPETAGYIVRAGLADRDVVQLKRGDPATATVDACPGRELPGHVSEIPAAAVEQSGLFEVEVTLVAFLCLVALGAFAFLNVSREEDPYFKSSAFYITVVVPGADPVDLERRVAKPIEDRLAELDDVKSLESTIVDGVSVTAIEFEAYTDPDKKNDEVTRELNALRPDLPAEASRVFIRKVSPSQVNIVQFALVSETATYRELEDLARALKDRLKTVDGVRTAESWAFPQRELRVEVDLRRMAELGVSPGQLAAALQSENADVPAGTLDLGPRSFSLKTSGGYADLEHVRDTVVVTRGRGAVRVRDIAGVRWADQPWSYVGRYNGQRAVFVTANEKDGYNILKVQARIAKGGVRLRRRPAGPGAARVGLRPVTQRVQPAEPPLRRPGHRRGARQHHAPAAGAPCRQHRHDLDPAVTGLRPHLHLLPRLLAEPAVDRRLRACPGVAGR